MSKEEKEYLHALYAGMAMMSLIQKGSYTEDLVATLSFSMADLMMERLEPKKGIARARRNKVE
jgi:hypothetical protein